MIQCGCFACREMRFATARDIFGDPPDGALRTWFFWTALQPRLPVFRAFVSPLRVRLRVRKVPRARARRHHPGHSPRRLGYRRAA